MSNAHLDIIRAMLAAIGEDPTREGIVDTPDRVVRSWRELYRGYGEDPAAHLDKTFAATSTQMITINDLDVTSTCEHHLLPFVGTCDISYLPNGRVVGLSKFQRLVDGFARRLQIQERLTDQIADAVSERTGCIGVAVRVRSRHSCMSLRGPRSPRASMSTTSLRGLFLSDDVVRREWISTLPP